MNNPLPLGKLPAGLLAEVLGLRPLPPEVLLGPAVGEDACAIAIGDGTLVAATDPITMTGNAIGRHAVFINANDIAVMGVQPRWFLAAVLLPPGTTPAVVRELFASMRSGLDTVGAALVGGHTEITSAVNQAVVIGQMLGYTPAGEYIRTSNLSPGDVVLQVGPAPIEGAAVLAETASESVLHAVDPALRAQAMNAVEHPGILVVEPALIAARGGAKAMHDPTEGGLATGLWEMALGAEARIDLLPEAIQWFEPGVALCRAAKIDPWGTLASGALLVGIAAKLAQRLTDTLTASGHRAMAIGKVRTGAGVFLDGVAVPRFERDELSRLEENATSTEG